MNALKFITCGSVDDGKSTLIGRLLVDTKAVLQDHLAGVQRSGETDLALLTDGLSAEREQGITIDVAYRYFNTEARKFIIGDAPGHEQYTRNMVTAASSADAAVVLVDAIKLDWANPHLQLLPQTRRHSLLVNLLRVPSIVFAINKLDAVANPAVAYKNIAGALNQFAKEAGITVAAMVPVGDVAARGSGAWRRAAGAGASSEMPTSSSPPPPPPPPPSSSPASASGMSSIAKLGAATPAPPPPLSVGTRQPRTSAAAPAPAPASDDSSPSVRDRAMPPPKPLPPPAVSGSAYSSSYSRSTPLPM